MNARENPFATDRIEQLLVFNPEWCGTTWSEIDTQWQKLGRRASLTGRHGAGKTTFIDAWQKRLHQNGHQTVRLFLNRECHTLQSNHWNSLKNCSGKIILLDGEEQLGWLARRKFYQYSKHAKGLLVSRHSQGKLPPLLDFHPDIQTVEHCIQKIAPDHFGQLSPHLADWWQQHDGNIRHILLRCYDTLRAETPSQVT